jgi:hypothetical protein
MVNNYTLVNPNIIGDFKNNIKAKNSIEAAQKFYKNLSEHFNNSVPNFYFSIQKGHSGKGKYYHFQVNETKQKDEVNFLIQPYKVNDGNMKKFTNKLHTFKNKIEQTGGKKKKHHKKDDSESESVSSTDSDFDFKSDTIYNTLRTYTPVVNQPFYYWWYDPYVYNLNSLWIPTFYSYVTPYIQIAV